MAAVKDSAGRGGATARVAASAVGIVSWIPFPHAREVLAAPVGRRPRRAVTDPDVAESLAGHGRDVAPDPRPWGPGPRRMATIAGAVVGLAVCVLLVQTGALRRTEVDLPRPDRSRELLAAFARTRAASFVMQSEFTRRMDDGRELIGSRLEVQRPPDRLVIQFGGVEGRKDGKQLVCLTGPDEPYHCGQGAPLPTSYEQDVAAEMEVLQSYFAGERPTYAVTDDDEGCFVLRQVVPTALPPTFGSGGRLCFDGRTGAMSRLERRIENATETLQSVSLRTDVTESDFDLSTQGVDEFVRDGVLISGGPGRATAAGPAGSVPEGAAPGGSAPPQPDETTPAPTVAPTTTVAAPDPCTRGQHRDGSPCSDDDLLVTCASGESSRAAARELWNRRLSVNDQRLVASPCGAVYVVELFSHGYRPVPLP